VSSVDIEEAQRQLNENGYGPNPFCERCQGKGWVYLDVPVSDERFGKAFACTAKGCLVDSAQKYKQGESYLASIGVSQPWCSFQKFKRIKGNEDAYKAFKDLAYGKTDLPFLLCYGGVGNGKSMLCQALAIVLNWRGVSVRFWAMADLMSKLKQGIANHTVDYEVMLLKEIEALILDDLGVEYGTDWEAARLEEIIDARYRSRLITVLTTNRDTGWLPERIFSRFSDPDVSQLVLNSAPDYRRREIGS